MAFEQQLLRSLSLPLFFLLAPFVFLKLKKFPLRNSLKYLYLNRNDFLSLRGLASSVSDSLLLFIAMVALSFIISFALSLFGVQDLYKVEALLRRQPSYVLFIATIISPFSEEIFFRGFLQRKAGEIFRGFARQNAGVLVSAVIFGAFHALYGSIAEVLGALLLGLLLGLYVRSRKSVAAPIFAHVLFNSMSIMALAGW